MQVDAKAQSHAFRYNLNYPSIGHCIIINNKNFDRRTGNTCFVLLKAVFVKVVSSNAHQTQMIKMHLPYGQNGEQNRL